MEKATKGNRHVVLVADIGDHRIELSYEANQCERQALCQQLGLLGLDRLAASFAVTREAGSVYRVDGRLRAHAIQSCVVTLTPVDAEIDAAFVRRFGAAEGVDETTPAIEIDLESDEDAFIEPLIGGAIDLGAAAAEQFALELNPFPRARDAVFSGYSVGGEADGGSDPAVAPFHALAALKNRFAGKK